MNKSAGFTLMETLASLTIVCFMTMLPTLAIHRWQETLKIEQFLATVEKQLRFAQQQAIVLEETQEVWFFEEQQSFSFPDKLNQSARRTSLAVPEKMTVSGPSKLSFLHSSGNNGRLVKYIFTWTEKKQQLILQFQMGSGKVLIYQWFLIFLPQVYHKSQV
ncbi:competence type IV pilus minor pilin ComGD, partial [Enterococcus faecalis]|uniref:competence type IV pilus minor pilin ComGD n=11 Tax=Enterococcus TaxID=1350 RepID=UPI0034A3E726